MADEERRKTYPYIPISVWWELRRRFQKSMPGQVTPSYLQTVLSVQEGHAKNLIGPLRVLGLISDEGRTTPLANQWRTDEEYTQACRTIVDTVYPQELTDAVPPKEPDKAAATRWFMRELRVGENAASRMANFYVLLCEADPSASMPERASRAGLVKPQSNGPKRASGRRAAGPPRNSGAERQDAPAVVGTATTREQGAAGGPSVHIDVQVHIPSDANADQIEAIFSAMAKHLYHRS